MQILIDSQKVVEVSGERMTDEGGHEYIVLDVPATFALLDAWRELDPKRRAFSWPGGRDNEDMIVAWYTDNTGLVTSWVPPFYDGRFELDAHALEAIRDVLPPETLSWDEQP